MELDSSAIFFVSYNVLLCSSQRDGYMIERRFFVHCVQHIVRGSQTRSRDIEVVSTSSVHTDRTTSLACFPLPEIT